MKKFNYENAMNVVMGLEIASGVFNIIAMKKNNVKLAAIGLGLYFTAGIVAAATSAVLIKDEM